MSVLQDIKKYISISLNRIACLKEHKKQYLQVPAIPYVALLQPEKHPLMATLNWKKISKSTNVSVL